MSEPKVGGTKPVVGQYEAGEYWWCVCGRSANQPFCDGSHAGTAFQPKQIELTEDTRCAWCTCKRTGNAPFCDGSHKGLA
jgi:CDGSH-type Zn-finger protein